MGLFDSKKTKQERELYQTLLEESKNCWDLAQDIGRFTEKEFLKPSNQTFAKMKQDIIDKYMLVMEIIKNNDLKMLKMNPQKGFQFLPTKTVYEYFKSRYDLTTFNGCYSLLSQRANLYEYFKNNNNGSVIEFLQSYDEINSAFLANQSKKVADNFQTQIKKGEEELDRNLAQLSKLEHMFGIDNSNSGQTQAEYDAKANANRDKLIKDLNDIRASIKSDNNHKRR